MTLARAGELLGLAKLDPATRESVSPVFRVPPRAPDFDLGGFLKTLEDHIRLIPEKIADAWPNGGAYVDLSLLDSETSIDGKHPLTYFVDEASARGRVLLPFITPASSADLISAAIDVHRKTGGGLGVLMPQQDWTTVNPGRFASRLAALGIGADSVDLFVDFEKSEGALIEVAVQAELSSLGALGQFRTVTVGGEGFPDLTNVPRGTTEYPRTEWLIYSALQARLAAEGAQTPDFFGHLILNTDSIELGIDPRFMSISAALRYTIADRWLLAKGQLFKGQGGSGQGGAALVDPLAELTRHSDFATPVRSQTDDWVESVAFASGKPGGPQQWREWGTLRHVEVTAFQLASLT